MTVYAKTEGTKVWSSVRKNHSQGRVPQYEPFEVMSQSGSDWYEIERPDNLTLDPQPNYPNYWVEIVNTVEEVPDDYIPLPPDPPLPPVEEISDEQAAWHLLMLLKWLKQQ